MTTIVFNYLQSSKKRAFMVKRFDKVIAQDLEFFSHPFKKWTVIAAMVDSLLTYLPNYRTKAVKSIIEEFRPIKMDDWNTAQA